MRDLSPGRRGPPAGLPGPPRSCGRGASGGRPKYCWAGRSAASPGGRRRWRWRWRGSAPWPSGRPRRGPSSPAGERRGPMGPGDFPCALPAVRPELSGVAPTSPSPQMPVGRWHLSAPTAGDRRPGGGLFAPSRTQARFRPNAGTNLGGFRGEEDPTTGEPTALWPPPPQSSHFSVAGQASSGAGDDSSITGPSCSGGSTPPFTAIGWVGGGDS